MCPPSKMWLQSSVLNTNISGAQYSRSACSHLSASTFTHESISGFLSGNKKKRDSARNRLRLDHVIRDDVAGLERKNVAKRFGRRRRILDLGKASGRQLNEYGLPVLRAYEDRDRPDSFLENYASLVGAKGDLTDRSENECAADGGMPGKRELAARGKDANATVCSISGRVERRTPSPSN